MPKPIGRITGPCLSIAETFMVCDEILPGNVSKEIASVELIVNSNSIFPFSSSSITSTSFASPSI